MFVEIPVEMLYFNRNIFILLFVMNWKGDCCYG